MRSYPDLNPRCQPFVDEVADIGVFLCRPPYSRCVPARVGVLWITRWIRPRRHSVSRRGCVEPMLQWRIQCSQLLGADASLFRNILFAGAWTYQYNDSISTPRPGPWCTWPCGQGPAPCAGPATGKSCAAASHQRATRRSSCWLPAPCMPPLAASVLGASVALRPSALRSRFRVATGPPPRLCVHV